MSTEAMNIGQPGNPAALPQDVKDSVVSPFLAGQKACEETAERFGRDPVLPQEVKDKIVSLFLAGQSINHIVFLLDYQYRIDDVSDAIRERLRACQQ